MSDQPPDGDEADSREPTETWVEQTSAFDRVMSVALSVDGPKTATWIADEAHVAETTARSHLERLVDLRVLTSASARGPTSYAPDSGYLRFRKVSELVEEYDKDEIVKYVAEIKADVESWRDEYDVEGPDELRMRATEDDVTAEETREYMQVASEWDSREHEQSIVREALERYDQFEGPSPNEVRS